MSRIETDRYAECIAAIGRYHSDLASALMPAGVTRFWAASLGWPTWLFDGASFPPAESLPGQIRLIDDLQLLANLLRHVGEKRLLELMLEWPRYPGEAQVLAAPDLKAAIWSRSASIDLRNAPIRVSVNEAEKCDTIAIELNPALGPFRPVVESAVLVVFFLMVRSFVGMANTAADDLSEISIEQVHSGAMLRRLLPCRFSRASSTARISIPDRLLEASNPDFDPVSWNATIGQARPGDARVGKPAPLNKGALEEMLRRSLAEYARVPQLAEIARLHGLSERTLARLFADAGISFRDTLDHARMSLGKELLLHSELPVYAVAERVGYSVASAFVRSFKRRFGIPPAQWRKGRRIAPTAHFGNREIGA